MACAVSPSSWSSSSTTAAVCNPRTTPSTSSAILTQTGWIGVVLFFALSGFLITGGLWDSLQDSPTRKLAVLRNFYVRRALRILPLYFAALLAAVVASIAFGSLFSDLRPLVIYALFLQNLPWLSQFVIRNPTPLPLYHLWSLAVEEQFYLLWPALLLLARTRRSAIHLCLWSFAIAVAFRLAVYGLPSLYGAAGLHNPLSDVHLFDFFLLTQCGALTLGAALALILRGGEATLQKLHRWAMPTFLACLALYALNSWRCHSLLLGAPAQFILGLPLVSVAATALLLLLLRPGIPRTLASIAPLPWLGRISYGFYVFHILLQPLYDRIAVRISHAAAGNTHYQLARLSAAFCLTVLAAWLSYRLLELPFLRAKRRFPLSAALPPQQLQP
jgi:peptidoglycan/LPS O-acetylase OafA/YrhL